MNWISVNNGLPENGVWCLCWEKYYSGSLNKPVIGYYDYGFMTEVADDYSDVTHWMPLPGAPTPND